MVFISVGPSSAALKETSLPFFVTPSRGPRSRRMVYFIRAGGYPIWIVIVLSVPLLYLGVRFAIAADARRLAIMRALTWAQLAAIGAGVASNVLAVMWHLGRDREPDASPLPALFIGLGEALTPAVLGLTFLSIVWILVAFGLRRAPRSDLD
jgi:hypothetical protein